MSLQRISVLVGIMVLAGCDSNDPFRPRLLADLTSDVTPPTLTALGFAPSSINTSAGPAAITVSFSVTDDVSGVHFVQVQFRSPSHATEVSNYSSFTAATAYSGTFDIPFPQYSESGTWTVDNVFLEDAVGNHAILSAADLAGLGFPSAITVFSANQDVTPPTLTGLGFAPSSINTSAGPAVVTVSFSVTDDVSGAHFVQVQFRSPSHATEVSNYSSFTAATSHSGTFDITFSQYSESGTWIVDNAFLEDAVGNHAILNAADLSAMGLPSALTVVNSIPVSIDIQPGSSLNSIKLSKQGKVTVAILSDAGFDAPSRVVRSSLTFGHNGDEPSLASCAKEGEDVNRDGFKDLVCQFFVQRTGFQVGDVIGILRGRTVDQVPIEGKDAVRILK